MVPESDLDLIHYADNNPSADSSGLPESFEGTTGTPGDADALRALADKTQGQLDYNKLGGHRYSLYSENYTDPNLRYTLSDMNLLYRHLTSLNKGYTFMSYGGPDGNEMHYLIYNNGSIRVATRGIIRDIRGL